MPDYDRIKCLYCGVVLDLIRAKYVLSKQFNNLLIGSVPMNTILEKARKLQEQFEAADQSEDTMTE
ncbi:MAG: hypothetical protein ACRC0B_04885, partial [Legionella sp.]